MELHQRRAATAELRWCCGEPGAAPPARREREAAAAVVAATQAKARGGAEDEKPADDGRKKVTVFFGTQTGTAEGFAKVRHACAACHNKQINHHL